MDAAGQWLSGVPSRVQDGSGTVRCSWTQLDLMAHDPKPGSRWPGTLRDYGRHADRTRFSLCAEWGLRRSAAIGHPVQSWVVQQARNLLMDLEDAQMRVKFVIHDRDASFTTTFDAVFQAAGIRVIRSAV